MKKIIIEDHFVLYHFPSTNLERLGHNIYVLIDKGRAMAIDTGYEQHLRVVIEDLKQQEIEIVKVLPSHFHPDHVDGLFLLNKPKIYGNKFAEITLADFYDPEDIEVLKPNKTVNNNGVIDFGEFKVKLTFATGHSDCSVVITINDRYLHVGDLYMLRDDGEQVLPYVKWRGIKHHIKSLKMIRRSECETYLLAHGNSPIDRKSIQIGIEDRLLYLEAIKNSNNNASVEEALSEVSQPFVFHKWRGEIIN